MNDQLAAQIDALLPQTQCRQCGYAGCRPYAEAIARDAADINQCPPGGEQGVRDIAALLRREPKALDLKFGVTKSPAVAVIDEAWCIGCTLCIQACPVDAIAGAAKVMHTVIAQECTGCELCIAPCPVDCIAMIPVARAQDRESRTAFAAHARQRFLTREARHAAMRTARPRIQNVVEESAGVRRKSTAVAKALARAAARIEEKLNKNK